MNTEIQAKIEKIREAYTDEDSLKFLSDIEKDLRNKIVQSDLVKNDVILQIVAEIERKINTINSLLQFDEVMAESDRKLLFTQRRIHQFYLDRFSPSTVDQKLSALNDFLDSKIAEMDEK